MSQENTADNGNSSVSGSTNSSDVHASINASNDGTTTTINGVTQQTPAGQPVDRSEQYQTDNGSVQVHMSSHSSSSADGSNTSSSQHINLNVNSKSGSQGVQSP